jgi:high affinity Mn2+ porin
MIGDGHLSYGLETVAEVFYEALLLKHLWLSADYQFVLSPADNRDRGPVNVFGARSTSSSEFAPSSRRGLTSRARSEW